MSRSYKLSLIVITLLMLATTLINLVLPNKVNAVSASDWNPGRIIDDAIFYNKDSMTVAQIQQFLDVKVPFCDRDRASSNLSYQPPWTCLKEYQENTSTKENNIGRFNPDGSPKIISGGKSAAQIIWEVGQSYGINPQVLIVMLQKEQSLITDNWPWKIQYDRAMGYACPDTAPCDAQYYGFYNQVSSAAWQLKRYVQYPDNYNFKSGVYRNILFNPNTSCGTTNVYIENTATAALYNYTPYQPNAAALNNLYGTGDGCSAYGNRNFWRIFNDWFGSTQSYFISLTFPRWMQLNKNTYKKNILTGESIGPELLSGRQIFFPDKIYVNGQWYLRTQWDKDNGNMAGIPLGDVSNVLPTPITPTWVSVPERTKKVDPVLVRNHEVVPGKSAIKVVDELTLNGVGYYRTEYERERGTTKVIKKSDTDSFKLYSFTEPRLLKTARDAIKINIRTGEVIQQVPANTYLIFSKRVTVGSSLYIQSTNDAGTDNVIKFSDTDEVPIIPFVSLERPRWMQLSTNTYKTNLKSGEQSLAQLDAGRQIYFPDKVFINGQWYLRTQWDKDNGNMSGIPLVDIQDIAITSITPKWVSLPSAITKINPLENTQHERLPPMSAVYIVDSIIVNGIEYYRTSFESAAGRLRFITKSSTEEFRFYSLLSPRVIQNNSPLERIDLLSGLTISSIPPGNSTFYNQRITVGSNLYIQASEDNGTNYVVKYSDL